MNIPSLLVIMSLTASIHAESSSYIDVFAGMQSQNSFLWPCPNSYGSDISSTFSPRKKVSTNAYDFHRGVDISGNVGDPVVAPYAGVVDQITTYADGGNTVILKHTFPSGKSAMLFDNSTATRVFYTLYMHLDEMLVQAGSAVSQGTVVGTIGMTGATSSPHLHYELRLGTRCSLEYALANPTSKCNTFGYDPHISAMLILPQSMVGTTQVTAVYRSDLSNNATQMVQITTPDINPNVNIYKVFLVQSNGQVRISYQLDLNRRIGFNATSTKELDTQNKSVPYLDPISFGQSAATWSINFAIPKTWYRSKTSDEFVVVEVVDVWGTVAAIAMFGQGETWEP